MAPSSRIPPQLQPHIRLPKGDSILLLTSTLGASANWLIVRFLCEAFGKTTGGDGTIAGDAQQEDTVVVLVSWMRDWDFWKSEARKGGGLDLERLAQQDKLAFVDGLSQMYLPSVPQQKTQPEQAPAARPGEPSRTMGIPMGRTPQTTLPARGPPGRIPVNPRAPATAAPVSNATSTPTNTSTPRHTFVTSPELHKMQQSIESAIRHLRSASPESKCLLILDSPSFLMASNPDITPTSLCATILHLNTLASHVLIHTGADDALISLSTPPQPLEIAEHNFLVKVAHMSARILSCRVLDTGFAKDVSGVLRITENGIGLDMTLQGDNDADAEEKAGRELLYLVKGDGSVKMFERGAGGDI